MDTAEWQARIDAVSWYHEFDFPDGLKARSNAADVAWHRENWRFVERHLGAVDFRGKSVLDVGCWDGYWSFFAERRGAASMLAVDDFSQNWADARGLDIARELLGSRVEVNPRLSVYDLASLGRRFDVVMFLGVYYHLLDPLHALAQLRHCCHANTVVLIEGAEAVGLPPQSAFLGLDGTASKFLPGPGTLEHLLRLSYLAVRSRAVMTEERDLGRPGWRWRLRMCRQALLGSRSGVAGLVRPMTAARRVFLTCSPVDAANELHVYRPPFGLHQYDPRFANPAP